MRNYLLLTLGLFIGLLCKWLPSKWAAWLRGEFEA